MLSCLADHSIKILSHERLSFIATCFNFKTTSLHRLPDICSIFPWQPSRDIYHSRNNRARNGALAQLSLTFLKPWRTSSTRKLLSERERRAHKDQLLSRSWPLLLVDSIHRYDLGEFLPMKGNICEPNVRSWYSFVTMDEANPRDSVVNKKDLKEEL